VPGGPVRRVDEVRQRVAVLAAQVGVRADEAVQPGAGAGGQAEQLGQGGGHVDEAGGPVHHAEVADATAGQDERRPGLDDIEGAVLTAVAAPVLVVVGGGVHHAQVGRRRVLEELRHLLVPVRVGVLRLGGIPPGGFGVGPGEAVDGLVGQRVAARHGEDLVLVSVASPAAGEADAPRRRVRLVGAVADGEDHLHDGLEGRVAQDAQGGLGGGGASFPGPGAGGRCSRR
jgi:hypothetical protein